VVVMQALPSSAWNTLLHQYGAALRRKIMNNASNLDHRELTDIELDAVTGGLVVNAIIMPLIALDIGRPPANASAMAAWNGLLKQNGF
jgi:hypothetical protein